MRDGEKLNYQCNFFLPKSNRDAAMASETQRGGAAAAEGREPSAEE
jgi:hypothetical protein